MYDLKVNLPRLLPHAIAWGETQEQIAIDSGTQLTAELVAVARSVGVKHPEKVFVLEVTGLPQPTDAELAVAAAASGLLGPSMVGLTLGYAIFVCKGYSTTRLLSHELRHVHQYEEAGSIAQFLPKYLKEIATVGYENAPYEIDARRHERQK